MSEKDYFGDDWGSDSGAFEESQIEYPEDLIDESFGVEDGVSSEGVIGSVETPDLVSPKRPKIAPKVDMVEHVEEPILGSSGDPVLDAILEGRAEEQLTVSKPQGEAVGDVVTEDDSYFEEVADLIGSSYKASPRKPNIEKVNPAKGVSQDADVDVVKKDLIDLVSAGIDETNFQVDIDLDPDEDESDSEYDVPLTTAADYEDAEEEGDEDFSDEDSGGIGYSVSEKNLDSANRKLVKSRKGRRPGPKKKRGPKPGLRLTARDVQILTFLARYRVATVGQLARAFETSETALRNRLPRLEKEKLVSWAWGAQSKPKLWLITRQGLQVTNMTLTVPTVKWGQLRHTLGLTDLGIEFELAGELVITEREIRAAATRYTPTSRIKTAIDLLSIIEDIEAEDMESMTQRKLIIPMQGRQFGHIPDMILAREAYPNGASGNIAIELELNRKNTTEWVSVLTAYRDSPLFEKVIYYTMNKEIKRALTAIAKAINAEDKIEVEFFVPVDNTADPLITGGK